MFIAILKFLSDDLIWYENEIRRQKLTDAPDTLYSKISNQRYYLYFSASNCCTIKPIILAKIYSESGDYLLGLLKTGTGVICEPTQYPVYTVFFLKEGKGIFHADFGKFEFTAPVLLFSTPLQMIYVDQCDSLECTTLQFHGDFYCIEYHRREVSCNGLLFNNIYVDPIVKMNADEAILFGSMFNEISEELKKGISSEIVLRAYLQLFLAKCSSIKLRTIEEPKNIVKKDKNMERFRQLLEEQYMFLHKPSDYAGLLAMSPNNFARRCTGYFKKSPSQLIQERLILEAKKQLHLTRQSTKEIAYNLRFQDEFYFSRVFKKFTKVSPQTFRDQTGISIVADLSKP